MVNKDDDSGLYVLLCLRKTIEQVFIKTIMQTTTKSHEHYNTGMKSAYILLLFCRSVFSVHKRTIMPNSSLYKFVTERPILWPKLWLMSSLIFYVECVPRWIFEVFKIVCLCKNTVQDLLLYQLILNVVQENVKNCTLISYNFFWRTSSTDFLPGLCPWTRLLSPYPLARSFFKENSSFTPVNPLHCKLLGTRMKVSSNIDKSGHTGLLL